MGVSSVRMTRPVERGLSKDNKRLRLPALGATIANAGTAAATTFGRRASFVCVIARPPKWRRSAPRLLIASRELDIRRNRSPRERPRVAIGTKLTSLRSRLFKERAHRLLCSAEIKLLQHIFSSFSYMWTAGGRS